MTVNLKTTEIVDAIITRITGATFSFVPVIVQEGDLSYYVQSEDITDDLPAIFVKGRNVAIAHRDLGAFEMSVGYRIRVLVLNSWTDATAVVDQRQRDAQEVAQVLIGTLGDSLELSIAGLSRSQIFVRSIDFEPPENITLSLNGDEQVYAVAIEAEVLTESTRP